MIARLLDHWLTGVWWIDMWIPVAPILIAALFLPLWAGRFTGWAWRQWEQFADWAEPKWLAMRKWRMR